MGGTAQDPPIVVFYEFKEALARERGKGGGGSIDHSILKKENHGPRKKQKGGGLNSQSGKAQEGKGGMTKPPVCGKTRWKANERGWKMSRGTTPLGNWGVWGCVMTEWGGGAEKGPGKSFCKRHKGGSLTSKGLRYNPGDLSIWVVTVEGASLKLYGISEADRRGIRKSFVWVGVGHVLVSVAGMRKAGCRAMTPGPNIRRGHLGGGVGGPKGQLAEL